MVSFDLENLAPLDRAIINNFNPFEPITFKSGNFWLDKKHLDPIKSIHKVEVDQIQQTLYLVKKDNCTRTIILTGDSGNGKTYLLKRLKDQFNDKAFFTYIEPCPSNDFIWRHTLRKTVDSLMATPKGEKESQLILWLKNLSTFRFKGFWAKFLGKPGHKGDFVNNLSKTYSSGIYQPKPFFKVLYELVNPHEDNYQLACQWLRGDELDEEDLRTLGVNKLISDEVAAKGILENFGRIADATKPIVLCFDQVELAPKLANGSYDLSGIFQVNTYFHNAFLTNFLIIVSILSDFWQHYKQNRHKSEVARLEQKIHLKQISLEQVKALWASRLAFIHQQVEPKPTSPIAPLDKYWEQVEAEYPGGKAIIRNSLTLAHNFYEEYKNTIGTDTETDTGTDKEKQLAAFKLIWADELKNTQETVKKINQFAEPELINMIIQALEVFPVKNIQAHLLTGVNGNKSLSFKKGNHWGVLWTEAAANSFTAAINACAKFLQQKDCQAMVLIREKLITQKGKGYQLYEQIFKSIPPNYHLIPTLEDVHYLRTYQKVANNTRSGDLVVINETINLATLHELVCESKVLNKCCLLQRLSEQPKLPDDTEEKDEINKKEIKNFIINSMINAGIIGKTTLITHIRENYSKANEQQIESVIAECCEAPDVPISLMNPNAKPADQILCYIPS